MKLIKTTIEARAYSEEEAKDYIEEFRRQSYEKGYTVGAAGYTYKTRKKEGDNEAWICKCVKIHDEVWDD